MQGISERRFRSQSTIEYITTYGWAIAAVAVSLAALFALGVFSPSSYTKSQCIFPSEFSCTNETLFTNGTMEFTFSQATESPIILTAIGCNEHVSHISMNSITPITLQISASTLLNATCRSGNVTYTSRIGALFSGYVVINYTDVQSGVAHTVTGSLIEKTT